MAKYRITPSSKAIIQLPISIGHKAEKGVEAIEFDVTAWVETYGSGTATIIMRRWGDAIPYPIALEIDENNKATWTLSDTDTAKAGMAYAQLNYIVGDEVVKKSDIYTFRVMDSLTGEGEPPEAYESWLEHLTHLAAEAMAEVLDIEGIVTDKTLTVDGGIADAKATGDALSALEDQFTEETDQLKADLVEVSNQPNISWVVGSSIGSDGNIGGASSYAYSSAIAVDTGGRIKRTTPYKDADSRILLIHVCQYDSLGTFISRTTLADGGEIVFESNTASIRFNFGRAASLHVPMTAEDIATYFAEKVYRKAVLKVDVNDIIEAKIAESVQTNDFINITMSQSIATNSYNNDLKQVPTNTYFFASYSWFNDYPHGIGATYFWIITLSSERNDRSAAVSVGSQICINPTNGNYAVRRILSGVWTEWSVINVPQYVSLPKYAAFGDSLTFGAVWDSNPETQWYQADFKDQIPTRIANAIGSNEFINYGVSGARFVKQSPSDTSTIIGDKVKSVVLTDIDIVTIGGGRNDSATALGNGATAISNDGTICGAVVDILTYLTTTYPKLQIVMYGVTPQPTSTSHDPEHIFTRVFAGGWSLATYYTEMSKVCARFGVPFIDWYDCPLILRWGVLSGGYSSGVQNWSHPLESSIYKQMGNYIGGRVSGYYRG